MDSHDRRQPRAGTAADAALGAVLTALLVGWAAAIAGSWGGGHWQFDFAAGAVASVLALGRRRHRLGAAVAGLAVGVVAVLVARAAELPAEPGPAATLALAVLVGSAVRTLPAPASAAVAAAGAAVVAGTWLAAPAPQAGIPPVTQLNGAGWVTAVLVGLGLRWLDERRRATAEQVRRDERLELARELHDVVAHHVTGIVLQAQAAQLATRRHAGNADGSLAGVEASLAGIEAAGSDGLAAVRRVVGLLRDTDDVPPAVPGPEQLTDMVERFAGRGPAVRLQLPDGETSWPPEVTGTVHRVVQEALTNVSRHAPHARSVTVTVAQDQQAVTVEVVDDAPQAPRRYRPHGGYGLIGMRERVETLGGTLSVGPRHGAGWSVRATLPIPARRPA